MNRFYYALFEAWRHRSALSQINARRYLLEQLHFEQLVQQGKKALAFDFDGVLAPYGSSRPDRMGQQLIESALAHFVYVYILSNKPTPSRQKYFEQHYPSINFITATRKKPFPDGLNAIIRTTQLPPAMICLVDDRLLTGVLACTITGVTPLLIANPRIDYTRHFMVECAIQALRCCERWLF